MRRSWHGPGRTFAAAVVLAFALLASGAARASSGADRTVVVLLFDGWAGAMVDAVETPVLDRMRGEGSWTHHFSPVFPTISMVNQVSISTGCLPEHHGIVSNLFLDPERGRYDHSQDADWLTGCEHLHQAAERQGVRSAVLGWVGRASQSRGKLASIVSEEKTFKEFPDDAERAQQVVALLQLPDNERPRLILAYFHGPDGAAHFSGMDSEKTRAAVAESDAAVGVIVAAIEQQPWRDQATVIVTTDHGMVEVSTIVNIKRILYNHGIDATAVSSGTSSFIYLADPGQVSQAAESLSEYPQFDVVRRDAQPADWNIGTGPRVGDLIVSAHLPYFIEDLDSWPSWLRWLGDWGPEFMWSRMSLKATHGYPPSEAPVDGILYAWGSGIAPGQEIKGLTAVDVHPTVCRLLDIAPGSPVDGEPANAMLSGN